MTETDQEIEEVLRLAVRIIARRENDGGAKSRTREGQDFLYRARKVLAGGAARRAKEKNETAVLDALGRRSS